LCNVICDTANVAVSVALAVVMVVCDIMLDVLRFSDVHEDKQCCTVGGHFSSFFTFHRQTVAL